MFAKKSEAYNLDANTSTRIGVAGDHYAIEKHSRHPLMPFLVFVCYAAFLILTLPDYGVTWDEIGWFNYGYQQWAWILNGAVEPLKDPLAYFHYGSLAPLAAAATHHLFHDILQWVSADVGYHLANVGFALILAAGILVWGKQTLGNEGATLALLVWMSLPRLWPDAHNNISDLPGAAGSLWAAWSAWRISQAARPRAKDYILCGFLVGIAYSLRAPNIYFLGLAILIWFCTARFLLKERWPSVPWWGLLLALAVFFLTVKLANPYLWNGSVLRQVFWTNPKAYLYSGVGKEDLWFMGRYYGLGSVPIYYAPWFWLISTPLLILFCWALAVGKIIQDRANASSSSLLFLVLWATAVFKHLTGSGNYDGIRHFLESYAPMSLLAAQGALILIGHIESYSIWRKRWAYSLVCLGLIIPLYSGWRIHPYQSGYFNIFAGSISHAWQDYEVEYWGYSFLRTSNWVKEHIGPNATVYVPDAGHIGKYYLDPPFKVSTIKIFDFSGVSEFVSHLMSMLEKASPGSVLMVLNRPRIWQRSYLGKNNSFECPPGWSLIHQEGPDSKLPPLMIVCQKKEVLS